MGVNVRHGSITSPKPKNSRTGLQTQIAFAVSQHNNKPSGEAQQNLQQKVGDDCMEERKIPGDSFPFGQRLANSLSESPGFSLHSSWPLQFKLSRSHWNLNWLEPQKERLFQGSVWSLPGSTKEWLFQKNAFEWHWATAYQQAERWTPCSPWDPTLLPITSSGTL